MQQITVDKILVDKPTKSGGAFIILQDEKGREYKTFDGKLRDMVGATIDIEYEFDDKNKVLIKRWSLLEPAAHQPAPPPVLDYTPVPENTDTKLRIVALDNASRLLDSAERQDVLDVLRVADIYYQWLNGQTITQPSAPPAQTTVDQDWNAMKRDDSEDIGLILSNMAHEAREAGYSPEELKDFCDRTFGITDCKALTYPQAKQMFKAIKDRKVTKKETERPLPETK